MKKIISILLVAIMLSACSSAPKTTTENKNETTVSEGQTSSGPVESSDSSSAGVAEGESESKEVSLEDLLNQLTVPKTTDGAAHVSFEQIPFTYELQEVDEYGEIFAELTVTNNSPYVLKEIGIEVQVPNSSEVEWYLFKETVLPGETSTINKFPAEADSKEADILTYEYRLEDEQNTYQIKYNIKTEQYIRNSEPLSMLDFTPVDEVPVKIDELEVGIIYGVDPFDGELVAKLVVKNNSLYPISSISLYMKVVESNTSTFMPLMGPIEPGATLESPSYVLEEGVTPDDYLTILYFAATEEGNVSVQYDYKLKRYLVMNF